jgi:hypothetical protein
VRRLMPKGVSKYLHNSFNELHVPIVTSV